MSSDPPLCGICPLPLPEGRVSGPGPPSLSPLRNTCLMSQGRVQWPLLAFYLAPGGDSPTQILFWGRGGCLISEDSWLDRSHSLLCLSRKCTSWGYTQPQCCTKTDKALRIFNSQAERELGGKYEASRSEFERHCSFLTVEGRTPLPKVVL